MARFRTKPVVIEATQWFKNGDHPDDKCEPLNPPDIAITEGKVVRYYRTPDFEGVCKHCSCIMRDHGWIDTLEAGHNVCPGDWIIKGVKGEFYPCKPDIFALTYESADAP